MPEQLVAKPIDVSAITLQRHGRALISLRAPVKDTEHLYFTVPKNGMDEALNSLEVYDSRGDRPRVSFPAPLFTSIKPLQLKKDSAWKDLLMSHQGAHVELHTRSGPVEGYFLGFQSIPNRGDRNFSTDNGPGLVLQTEGNVCMHPVGSISAIAFKGFELAKKLERYSSSLCHSLEADSVYRFNITASGVGTGEVCASYAVSSPFTPAFDFSYSIHDDEDTDVKGTNKTADGVLTVHPKVNVKCYAVIRSPLHYDISDVQFILQSGYYRATQTKNIYSVVDKPDDAQTWSTSSSTTRNRPPSRFRSPSPKRESPGRAPSPPRPNISARSNQSGTDTESDSAWDAGSAASNSTTSVEAYLYDRTKDWVVPDVISLKEGESVKVLLGETQLEGAAVNAYGVDGKSRRSIMLHNTTDTMFEPGPVMFFTKGLCVNSMMTSLKPGEQVVIDYGPSACAMEHTETSRRGKVLSSRITGKELVAKVMWFYQRRYIVHNKEDEQADVFILHASQEKTGSEVEISAKLYPNTSRTGEEEDEGTGEPLDQFSKGYLRWAPYMVRMAPKQRSALVVSETNLKVEKYSIFGCSKDAITKLEQKKVVGQVLADKLRELADMRRKMEKLSRTKELHRIRLDGIKGYERGLARANISKETLDGDEGNRRFFGEVSAAEDAMAEIEDSLDAIECERVKLIGQMKITRQEICDMKCVELENAVKV